MNVIQDIIEANDIYDAYDIIDIHDIHEAYDIKDILEVKKYFLSLEQENGHRL